MTSAYVPVSDGCGAIGQSQALSQVDMNICRHRNAYQTAEEQSKCGDMSPRVPASSRVRSLVKAVTVSRSSRDRRPYRRRFLLRYPYQA